MGGKGICFETPSVREFRKLNIKIQGSEVHDSSKFDYLKVIRDSNGNTLGVMNKFSKKYMFFCENIDVQLREKIEKIIIN